MTNQEKAGELSPAAKQRGAQPGNDNASKLADFQRIVYHNARLPRWLCKWLDSQPESAGRLIEEALIEKYNLTAPIKPEKKQMSDNWERNRIVTEAAERIMSQANPAILDGSKRQQIEAVLKMRHQLVDETRCSFDTTARHIGLGKLKSVLGRTAG